MDYTKFVPLRMALISAISHHRPSGDMNALNIRCPHCGDSKKSRSKRRGFFLMSSENTANIHYYYKCHNGGCQYNDPISVDKYLERHHKDAHSQYKLEVERGVSNPDRAKQMLELFSNWKEEQKVLDVEVMKRVSKSMKTFIPLSDVENDHSCHDAIVFLRNRLIPEEIWRNWAYCPPNATMYSNRIIIPYRKQNGRGVFFQARTIDPSVEPRYLTRSQCDREIYNMDFVDLDAQVFILEGAIDSIFVRNSIALSGLSATDRSAVGKWIRDIPHKVWFLDGDISGIEKSIKLLLKGESVVSWMRILEKVKSTIGEIDVKDVNDLVRRINKPFFFDALNLKEFIVTGDRGVVVLREHLKKLKIKEKMRVLD